MSSSSSCIDWRYFIHYLDPMELTESPIELTEELIASSLTSQETPKFVLSFSFDIKNIYQSSSGSSEQVSWIEEDWISDNWITVQDLRCFTHTLPLAKHSIRRMIMAQTSVWERVPWDILESMITLIASDFMEYWLNEGFNTASGYASIPCFQVNVKLTMTFEDEEEVNFRLAAEDSLFDAAQQRDDVVLQCPRPRFAELLESLVTEIVGAILEDDKKDCVICKDEFVTGEEVKRLPCSHRFHEQCITRWFQEKNTCPLCRHIIQV